MVPATSGNFSARLDNGNIAITVSGCHKGHLRAADIMPVDSRGQSLYGRRSSAETALHIQIYQRFSDAGVVLHPHSIHATLLLKLLDGPLELEDYELLKAFPGITTHDTRLTVPVFNNDQNIEHWPLISMPGWIMPIPCMVILFGGTVFIPGAKPWPMPCAM